MNPSAYLINTARARIVDETALLSALQERWIAGAGLDVLGEEPLPPDDPFRVLDNVVATPHLGFVTVGNYRQYYETIVEDIAAWLDGAPVRLLGVLPAARLWLWRSAVGVCGIAAADAAATSPETRRPSA